jgi:hypothetical protein
MFNKREKNGFTASCDYSDGEKKSFDVESMKALAAPAAYRH